MREATATALEMVAGYGRADLSTNNMLAMALTRCLEILGEAASKVSADTAVRLPAIPFSKIVAMRNRLIHAYFDINLDTVWATLTDDLPALLVELDQALALID